MALVWAVKKRIAIVDYHAAVRELLCRYLERSPEYEVVGEAGAGAWNTNSEGFLLTKQVGRSVSDRRAYAS